MTEDKTNGWIYVIRTRENILVDKMIYKIGQTKSIKTRLKAYPNGSSLMYLQSVSDCKFVEKVLKQKLYKQTDLCEPCYYLGIEWFEQPTDLKYDFIAFVKDTLSPFRIPEDEKIEEEIRNWYDERKQTNDVIKNDDVIKNVLSKSQNMTSMQIITEMLAMCTEEFDNTHVAYILFIFNGGDYVLSGERDWYYQKNCRWYITNCDHTIHNIMKETVVLLVNCARKYQQSNKMYLSKINDANIYLHSERLLQKINNITDCFDIQFRLRTMLYNPNFKNEMDSKANVIAFENGVWDFDIQSFRSFECSDMVLIKPINMQYDEMCNESAAQEVEEYLGLIFPDPIERENIIKMIARQLYGDKNQKQFYVHKTYYDDDYYNRNSFFQILEECFGEYIQRFSIQNLKLNSLNYKGDFGESTKMWKGARILFCNQPADVNDKKICEIFKKFMKEDKIFFRDCRNKHLSSYTSMFNVHFIGEDDPLSKCCDTDVKKMTRYVLHNENDTSERKTYLFDQKFTYIENLKNDQSFKMEFIRKIIKSFEKDFVPTTITSPFL